MFSFLGVQKPRPTRKIEWFLQKSSKVGSRRSLTPLVGEHKLRRVMACKTLKLLIPTVCHCKNKTCSVVANTHWVWVRSRGRNLIPVGHVKKPRPVGAYATTYSNPNVVCVWSDGNNNYRKSLILCYHPVCPMLCGENTPCHLLFVHWPKTLEHYSSWGECRSLLNCVRVYRLTVTRWAEGLPGTGPGSRLNFKK